MWSDYGGNWIRTCPWPCPLTPTTGRTESSAVVLASEHRGGTLCRTWRWCLPPLREELWCGVSVSIAASLMLLPITLALAIVLLLLVRPRSTLDDAATAFVKVLNAFFHRR